MPPAIQQQEEETVLMAASQHITTSTNKSSSTTNTSTNTNTETLARNNKLRLQINELLNESVLHVHPSLDHHNHGSGGGGGGGGNVVEAKWSNTVRSYISNVSSIIGSLDETLLSPNVALLPNNNTNSSGSKNVEEGVNKYRVPLLSDKFHKSITSPSTSTSTSSSPTANPLTSYTFPFNGGKSLSIIPIGSFAHLYNAGLTSVHGNGNVLPTLDLAVLVNVDDDDYGDMKDGDKGRDGKRGEFVGGKDYLNHRYTDVSFVLSVCCC